MNRARKYRFLETCSANTTGWNPLLQALSMGYFRHVRWALQYGCYRCLLQVCILGTIKFAANRYSAFARDVSFKTVGESCSLNDARFSIGRTNNWFLFLQLSTAFHSYFECTISSFTSSFSAFSMRMMAQCFCARVSLPPTMCVCPFTNRKRTVSDWIWPRHFGCWSSFRSQYLLLRKNIHCDSVHDEDSSAFGKKGLLQAWIPSMTKLRTTSECSLLGLAFLFRCLSIPRPSSQRFLRWFLMRKTQLCSFLRIPFGFNLAEFPQNSAF